MDDSNKETENTRESSKNRAWGKDGNLASGEASMKGGNEVIERKSRDKEIPAESRQRSGINKQKRELSLGSSSSQESKRLRSNLKRSRAQTAQAQKMTEAYVKEIEAEIGSIVSIKVDFRDRSHSNPRGINAVIIAARPALTFSVKLETQWGILVNGRGKREPLWYLPSEFGVLDECATLPKELKVIQSQVRNDSFEVEAQQKVTPKAAHQAMTGVKSIGRNSCNCQKGCSNRCGCVRRKQPCNSSCKCYNNQCGNACEGHIHLQDLKTP